MLAAHSLDSEQQLMSEFFTVGIPEVMNVDINNNNNSSNNNSNDNNNNNNNKNNTDNNNNNNSHNNTDNNEMNKILSKTKNHHIENATQTHALTKIEINSDKQIIEKTKHKDEKKKLADEKIEKEIQEKHKEKSKGIEKVIYDKNHDFIKSNEIIKDNCKNNFVGHSQIPEKVPIFNISSSKIFIEINNEKGFDDGEEKSLDKMKIVLEKTNMRNILQNIPTGNNDNSNNNKKNDINNNGTNDSNNNNDNNNNNDYIFLNPTL